MREKIELYLKKVTPARMIVLFYLMAVIVATILLSLPVSRKPDAPWSLIDTVFTAVSAVSVTGLTTEQIAGTYSAADIIILIMFSNWRCWRMAMGTFFWLIFRKNRPPGAPMIMTDQTKSIYPPGPLIKTTMSYLF